MVILLALKWWYSAGWQWVWTQSVSERIKWVNQAFSISALVRTWFSPFKQTYSKVNKGSIDFRVQAAVDNFVSRFIGSILRTIIIISGLLCMILAVTTGVVAIIFWPVIPLMPLIAIILSVSGLGA